MASAIKWTVAAPFNFAVKQLTRKWQKGFDMTGVGLCNMTGWKRRILIVDDEPDVTFTLKKGLEEEGFQIDIFNDPLEAQSYFKAGQYDMLLLDVNMPKLNGFELYRELKKNRQ